MKHVSLQEQNQRQYIHLSSPSMNSKPSPPFYDRRVAMIRNAVKFLERGDPSYRAAAKRASVSPDSLKKQYLRYTNSGVSQRLDACSFSCSFDSIHQLANQLVEKQHGPAAPPISKKAMKRIISRLELPCRKVRSGISAREKKSKHENLIKFYSTLEELIRQLKLLAEHM